MKGILISIVLAIGVLTPLLYQFVLLFADNGGF